MVEQMVRLFSFAGLASGAAATQDPPMMVVVFTGLTLVFSILVILWLALLASGKLFASLDEKKKQRQKEEAAKVQPAAPAVDAPPAPVIQEGIPPEVVAAITAAVASIEGGRYTLRAVQTSQKGRGQWGLAGVIQSTEPF